MKNQNPKEKDFLWATSFRSTVLSTLKLREDLIQALFPQNLSLLKPQNHQTSETNLTFKGTHPQKLWSLFPKHTKSPIKAPYMNLRLRLQIQLLNTLIDQFLHAIKRTWLINTKSLIIDLIAFWGMSEQKRKTLTKTVWKAKNIDI